MLSSSINNSAGAAYTCLMDAEFFARLMKHHQQSRRYPPSRQATAFADHLLFALFPEKQGECVNSLSELEAEFEALRAELRSLLEPLRTELTCKPAQLAEMFMGRIPAVFDTLMQDAQAMLDGDPAARSQYEVIRAYPGFYAVSLYRFAHELYALNIPLIPRLITEYAHSRTGIDIHPGATIGPQFCIDHGTGVVIGETTHIGRNVKVYQGVTLGALSVTKELASTKRHPTIEDDVVIYAGATILGGKTVIGQGSVIGGNVWITQSVPAHSRVYYHGGDQVQPGDDG